MKSGWFDIEDSGFIRQQAGRPAEELVRELVQNAFDARGVSEVVVTTERTGNYLEVTVSDNGCGFDTDTHVYTVFLSGKQDNPQLRGRKGRGLKEAIAASSSASVELCGKTLEFSTKKGGKRVRKTAPNPRTSGTKVSLKARGWKTSDIRKSLKTFQPPADVTFKVDGEVVHHRKQVNTVDARLQTLWIDEDGVERKKTLATTVDLLEPKDGETPHLYEMGIPVCAVDTPWHLDVQQRVPLPDHRTTVSPAYLLKVKAQVLAETGNHLQRDDLQETWVTTVLDRAPADVQQRYVREVFGSNVAVKAVTDKRSNTIASEDLKANVVDTRHLPKAVREVLRDNAPSTTQLIKEWRERATPVHVLDPTPDEAKVLRLTEYLGKEVTGKPIKALIKDKIIIFGKYCGGSYGDGVICFSRDILGKTWFKDPFAPDVLRLIIHEIAHAVDNSEEGGHTPSFYKALEKVAGQVASLSMSRKLWEVAA